MYIYDFTKDYGYKLKDYNGNLKKGSALLYKNNSLYNLEWYWKALPKGFLLNIEIKISGRTNSKYVRDLTYSNMTFPYIFESII